MIRIHQLNAIAQVQLQACQPLVPAQHLRQAQGFDLPFVQRIAPRSNREHRSQASVHPVELRMLGKQWDGVQGPAAQAVEYVQAVDVLGGLAVLHPDLQPGVDDVDRKRPLAQHLLPGGQGVPLLSPLPVDLRDARGEDRCGPVVQARRNVQNEVVGMVHRDRLLEVAPDALEGRRRAGLLPLRVEDKQHAARVQHRPEEARLPWILSDVQG
mmetsp:Transcript_75620/g.211979  ORF Transcript_75620/g.211979 Transcript_75620/m.211979 type:complete len:212 (+) Transcript_75620:456-1091(+)